MLVLLVGVLLGILFSRPMENSINQSATVVSATIPTLMAPSTSCDDNISFGNTALNPIIFTLSPGQTQKVHWDYSNCDFGIQNYQVYAMKPMSTKGGNALASGTPLSMNLTNINTGEVTTNINGFVMTLSNVSKSVVEASYTNNGKKSLSMQLQLAYGMGGPAF